MTKVKNQATSATWHCLYNSRSEKIIIKGNNRKQVIMIDFDCIFQIQPSVQKHSLIVYQEFSKNLRLLSESAWISPQIYIYIYFFCMHTHFPIYHETLIAANCSRCETITKHEQHILIDLYYMFMAVGIKTAIISTRCYIYRRVDVTTWKGYELF